MNPLIVILSPRDVKVVQEQIEKVLYGHFDVLWIKYFSALNAYNTALNTVLRHSEYDGLVIIPDDLVLNQDSWDRLYRSIETGKYDMISGVCNISAFNRILTKKLNVTYDVIPDIFEITHKEIKDLWVNNDDLPMSDEPMKMAFAGFAVTYFSRKFLEGMKEFKENKLRQSIDVQVAKWAKANGIDQYIVPSARFLHLRGSLDRSLGADDILTGKSRPYMKFITKQNKVTTKYLESVKKNKQIVAKVIEAQ